MQAAGIGWHPKTVHAMRAGVCVAAARCCDERFWVRAKANGPDARVAAATKAASAKAVHWLVMLAVTARPFRHSTFSPLVNQAGPAKFRRQRLTFFAQPKFCCSAQVLLLSPSFVAQPKFCCSAQVLLLSPSFVAQPK